MYRWLCDDRAAALEVALLRVIQLLSARAESGSLLPLPPPPSRFASDRPTVIARFLLIGTLDDDETMVGTSPNGWPWTFYILADVPDRDTAVAACNLFRTVPVGEHRLWKYIRVEARIGRELVIPE